MLGDLNALVLTWIIDYGSPVVAGALLLGAAGLPLPGTLIVIAAAAFVRLELLDAYSTPVFALGGVVAGDTLIYGLGHFVHGVLEQRFGKLGTWQKAQAYFARRGGIAIYLTRWLLTPLAVPTNLIAGGSSYPFGKFLLFDIAGELTWIILFGALGYAFGEQWDLLGDLVSDSSGLVLSILAVGLGSYLLIRHIRTFLARRRGDGQGQGWQD